MKFQNKTVIITGGVSGIGRIMARKALERGASKLIIWDINEAAIETVKQELSTVHGSADRKNSQLSTIYGYKLDVSNAEMVEQVYNQTKADCGDVDILIQCAGIVRGNKTFDEQTVQDMRLTMEINSIAPMVIAQKVLADMLKRNSGHICNIASAAGMLGVPKLSVYVASKWAVIGWADSVQIELKQRKSAVKFTTIAPYFINTGMFNGVNSPIFPILEPEKTSEKIMRAIERNKNFKGIPFSFHFIRFMQGLIPRCPFDWIFGKVFGVYQVMDHFTGRKS